MNMFRHGKGRTRYNVMLFLSLIPMPMLYLLSKVLYVILFYVVAYRKSVVIQNVSRSFPEKRYDEVNAIVKDFYHSLCDNMVETLKSASIMPELQKKKVMLSGFEPVMEQIKQGKHVIAAVGHCGNWEMLNIIPALFDVDMYAAYKPIAVKSLDRMFIKIRSRFGMKLLPYKTVARHFMSNKTPSLYFLLADQCPKQVSETFRFNFLNQDTGVFQGVEKLACKVNACVVYLNTVRVSRGLYKIECREITTNSHSTAEREITGKYIRLLEDNILENPGGWLWSHKRWKR
ncbi:MAG: lysophospholipid acyltransferase family protein [Dysgonamonadaceae bacterium]|jgi:KDO2-lipid IV(A) lauroyltransferase|nr:lysophospholipid acyltransferase family protein [Dysgonamonadaceae bacterium]